MSVFDFNQFMQQGFSYFPVAYNVTEEAVAALKTEKWQAVDQHQWVPSLPQYLSRYQLSLQWMDFFVRNTFGDSFVRIQADMWKGSKPLQFHNCDTNRLQLFSYLGAQQWNPNAGGRLLVRNQLSGEQTAIDPSCGTCVILNGITQGFQHAVEPLDPQFAEDRIILAVDYKMGSSENECSS